MFSRFHAAITALAVVVLSAVAGAAAAQSTLSFTSPAYSTVINGAGCSGGDCGATYTTAMNLSGTITFAAPLAPNLVNADVGAQITAFNFNDGQRITASTDPTAIVYAATVSTDAAGVLTSYVFLFERVPGPPYTINDPADSNSRFSYVQLTQGGAAAANNAVCGQRGLGLGASAAADPVRACQFDTGSVERSAGISGGPVVVTAAATVPTLSEWAMILFGVILAGGAAVLVQRRRLTA